MATRYLYICVEMTSNLMHKIWFDYTFDDNVPTELWLVVVDTVSGCVLHCNANKTVQL